MTQEELKNLIGYKEDRVEILKAKKQSLVTLEEEISTSKFKRSMQSAFYNVKRFFLLFLTVIFILAGFTGLIYPKFLFLNSSKYKSDVVTDFQDNYQDNTSKTLEISLKELQGNNKINNKTVVRNIEDSVVEVSEDNAHFFIRVIAFSLILFALVLWYISSLTIGIRNREEVVSKVIVTNKDIIKDYELNIAEEEREISDLKQKLS